jgi:hypothetical protein
MVVVGVVVGVRFGTDWDGSAGIRSGAPSMRTSRTATMDSAAMRATSTTSWNLAAWVGSAPPSRAPMKAPGSVTTPVVLVWSMAGMSASAAADLAMSSTARRELAPSASQPSTSSRRVRRPSSSRRPASVAAVIVLPMTMPPSATT